MSVGDIVVRLELNDGQFTARMNKAGKTISTFSSTIDRLDKRVSKVEKGLVGFIPKLRDIAIVAASARVVIHGLSDTIGGFTDGIIKSNAEIERLTVLLQGISKAPLESGKIKEAGNNIKFLFDMAQRAPFSIKELSNSFVKMKAAGIEGVDGKIQSLTDSIARFGGDEQTLHRATIAIQQMASKGVVSMEELRQQLGEAVPNAMNLMADGMGMTMGDMVKAISNGRVKAIPAINAMMEQMNATMSGSSERMMQTWNGLMSRLSTSWILLQKQIGDAGFFEGAKAALTDLNSFLNSDQALAYGQAIGVAMRDITLNIVYAIKAVAKYSTEIGRAIKATVILVASIKAIATVTSIVALATTKIQAFSKAWAATATVARVASTGFGAVTTSVAGASTAATVAGASMSRLGLILSTLGGPLNIIIGILTAAAAAWVFFGNKGSEAYEKIKKSRKGLTEFEQFNIKLKTKVEIDNAQSSIDSVIKDINAKKKELERETLRIKISPLVTGLDVNIFKKWKERQLKDIADLEKSVAEATKNNESDRLAMLQRQAAREANLIETRTRKDLARYNQRYTSEIALAREARDKILRDTTKSDDDYSRAKKIFGDKVSHLLRTQYESQRIDLKSHIADMNTSLQSLSDKNITIKAILSTKDSLESARNMREKIIQNMAKIEIAINKSTGDDVLGLKSKLAKSKKRLIKVNNSIKRTAALIDHLKGGAKVDGESIIKLDKLLIQLPKANKLLSEIEGNIDNLANGRPPIDSKKVGEGTTALEKMTTVLNSISDRNAGLKDAVNGGNSSIGRQLAKMKRLYLATGETAAGLKALNKAENLLAQNRGFEATLEVAKEMEILDGKISRLKANLNEGDPHASLIYKIKTLFDKQIITDETMTDFTNKINQIKALTEAKDSAKREKWIKQQTAKSAVELLRVQAETASSSIAMEKYAVDARIRQLNRLADAKHLSESQRKTFVGDNTELFKKTQLIKLEKQSANEILAIQNRTAKARIGLIDDAYNRERASLKLSIAGEKKKYDLVIKSGKASKEQLSRAKRAIKALDDFRLASIAKIDKANKSSFETMLDNYKITIDDMDKLAVKFTDNFANSIADFVTTGKKTFGDFAQSIIADIGRMMVKAAAADLINTLMGRKKGDVAGGGFAGVVKGLLSGPNKQAQVAKQKKPSNTEAAVTGNTEQEIAKRKGLFEDFFNFRRDGDAAVTESSKANLASVADSSKASAGLMSGAMGSFVDMTIGGFAAMAINGKLSMKSLLKTVLSAIAAMIVKYLALAAVKAIAGFASGGSTANVSTGGASGATASLPLGNAGGDILGAQKMSTFSKGYAKGGAVNVSSFADGGAMKIASQLANAPFMSEMDMKRGGVKKSPHVALFAESTMPEAFIPMKDGKNIPLMLSQDSSGKTVGKIPLPSGETLPAKVISDTTRQVSTFANGGAMNNIKTPSSHSNELAVDIAGYASMIEAIDGVRKAVESINPINTQAITKSTRSNPLNNGKNAPLSSQTKGDSNVSITINVADTGNTKSKGGNGNDRKFWTGISGKVKSMITQEIVNEKRPGGLLS